ncbi:carboxypeptidase-like regulatory domain-containing protein [Psychroserpens sp.]|uniref:carboxypeptidase-like regulatory domain-containing protein n=1 Tax=Psychroserpens sp. TaxID=2020870 RepID=UPI002B2724EB|nr:carboxypeptidase-like regulatory domain-containing protein [Psychroserpens sp.]
MKNQLNLEIQTPCSENFNQFKSTAKGGFCSSCEKEVIDFTKMNAQETINYFKNRTNKNTCGRFKSSQLASLNSQPKHVKKLSFFGGIGLACISLFSLGSMQAQDAKQQTKDSENEASKFTIKTNETDVLVKGNVSEASLPLAGVNIILEGTTLGTQTDFDGNFEFPKKLKKGDVLIFSYLGFKSQKLVIDNDHSATKIQLQVDMEFDACIVMGKVAVKEVYTSKKNK